MATTMTRDSDGTYDVEVDGGYVGCMRKVNEPGAKGWVVLDAYGQWVQTTRTRAAAITYLEGLAPATEQVVWQTRSVGLSTIVPTSKVHVRLPRHNRTLCGARVGYRPTLPSHWDQGNVCKRCASMVRQRAGT